MRGSLTFILFLVSFFALGQNNLVPNPSFEDYTSCPDFASQLNRAAPWFNPNLGTPEYFNACATVNSYMSLPAGTTGHFQYPRTGNGFAGIYVFRTDIQNMREYIEVELTEPLQADKCYYLEFYVNMPNDHAFACDGIGAYVSSGELTSTNANPFMVTPQVQHTMGDLITDTLGWTKVSGYFTASGGENHLTIGNFKNDASTTRTQINQNVWYTSSAYLYVDDVTLVLHELEVELGSDTTFCEGETLLLDAETQEATYAWEDGGTQPTRIVSNEGEYWVEVTLGGCKASDSILLFIEPLPFIELGDDVKLCDEGEITLHASTNTDNLVWNDGSSDTVLTTNQSGIYWAQAYNDCGTVSDTVAVTIEECVCYAYIPNAFTPNGDNVNDVLSIGYDCSFSHFDFRIFDRWGSIIFKSEEPDFEWDGENIPIGNYTYQLQYSSQDVSTGKGLKIGTVKVIR